jgi:hypothetical protein
MMTETENQIPDTAAMESDLGMAVGAMSVKEHCIPVAALAMPDESEQLVNPERGDRVTYTVEGTLDRIEGDKAIVKVDAVNGSSVADAEPKESERYEDLTSEATEMDQAQV